MADEEEALRAALRAEGINLPPGHHDGVAEALIQLFGFLPPEDRKRLDDIARTRLKLKRFPVPPAYEAPLREWQLARGVDIMLAEDSPPYPAELAHAAHQDGAAKAHYAQIRTLAIVLVWLVAMITPVVEQRIGAEAQSITQAEVGQISLALAITVLMKKAR
jgi:hypothetical protein